MIFITPSDVGGLRPQADMPNLMFSLKYMPTVQGVALNLKLHEVMMMLDQTSESVSESKPRSLFYLQMREKRSSPRDIIRMALQYQLPRQQQFLDGELQDISTTGMLLRLKEQAEVGETIQVMITSDASNKHPIVINALIVRDATPAGSSMFSYGCKICRTWDFNIKR